MRSSTVALLLFAFTAFAEEGLPPEAPRTGAVITIDVSTNQAYFFRDGMLVKKSKAASGSDNLRRMITSPAISLHSVAALRAQAQVARV